MVEAIIVKKKKKRHRSKNFNEIKTVILSLNIYYYYHLIKYYTRSNLDNPILLKWENKLFKSDIPNLLNNTLFIPILIA